MRNAHHSPTNHSYIDISQDKMLQYPLHCPHMYVYLLHAVIKKNTYDTSLVLITKFSNHHSFELVL